MKAKVQQVWRCLTSGKGHNWYALLAGASASFGANVYAFFVHNALLWLYSLAMLIIDVGVVVDLAAHDFCH